MLRTQVFHGSLSLVGGQEVCPAHSSEVVHRLSHTTAALRQSKASIELEDPNAYNYPRTTLRSSHLSTCDSRGPVGQPEAQREVDETICYSGVKLSSLPVIPGLSSGNIWRKISSTPHRSPQRKEFTHCEASTAPLTGDTGLRTDTHAHLYWVVGWWPTSWHHC